MKRLISLLLLCLGSVCNSPLLPQSGSWQAVPLPSGKILHEPPAAKALFSRPGTFDIWLDDFYLLAAAKEGKPVLLDDFKDKDLSNAAGGRWGLGASAPESWSADRTRDFG
jgi:hypothetical protein